MRNNPETFIAVHEGEKKSLMRGKAPTVQLQVQRQLIKHFKPKLWRLRSGVPLARRPHLALSRGRALPRREHLQRLCNRYASPPSRRTTRRPDNLRQRLHPTKSQTEITANQGAANATALPAQILVFHLTGSLSSPSHVAHTNVLDLPISLKVESACGDEMGETVTFCGVRGSTLGGEITGELYEP